MSFVYVSCSDTPFPAQKSVSRAGLGRFVVSLRRAGVFLMPRHTLFAMKPCIANSFLVIWPCFVPRHTFFLTKVCIASRVGAVCRIVEACRRVPHAATHLLPHKSLCREQSDMSSPDFQLAIQVFSIKRVCRRKKTHTLNPNATAAHENLLLRVCRG